MEMGTSEDVVVDAVVSAVRCRSSRLSRNRNSRSSR